MVCSGTYGILNLTRTESFLPHPINSGSWSLDFFLMLNSRVSLQQFEVLHFCSQKLYIWTSQVLSWESSAVPSFRISLGIVLTSTFQWSKHPGFVVMLQKKLQVYLNCWYSTQKGACFMSTFSATDPGFYLGNYFKSTTRFLKKYLFKYFVSEFWDLVITSVAGNGLHTLQVV